MLQLTLKKLQGSKELFYQKRQLNMVFGLVQATYEVPDNVFCNLSQIAIGSRKRKNLQFALVTFEIQLNRCQQSNFVAENVHNQIDGDKLQIQIS
ncbi:MAG: hypothetical protein EZS28_008603 [Streblomastix strix]|uniref:Uncharacterized protein n=1 Tax=Streblomastix strix TaxID=222440 RepID=A0A5J4WLC7_9EUKA|nr:MAG: hypothetical protein EZS28_008603 [Streblomastix strix]